MESLATKTIKHISGREAKRLASGLFAWNEAKKVLAEMGVVAELFGSMARGKVHDRSDIDVLVVDRNGHKHGKIMRVIEDFADDIPVDTIFAEDLSERRLARMRAEASPI